MDFLIFIFHLFYADDLVFIGVWKDSNIQNIVGFLQFFHLALGLNINLHKSKLLGIKVHTSKVEAVVSHIGCAPMNTLFHCLGLKFGGNMS